MISKKIMRKIIAKNYAAIKSSRFCYELEKGKVVFTFGPINHDGNIVYLVSVKIKKEELS